MASAPLCTAIFASSTSRMPFSTSGPPQSFFTHSTSFHESVGSNWPAIHCESVVRLPALGMRSSRLPKLFRLLVMMFSAQPGFRRMSNAVPQVSFGGTASPFFRSRWRCPWICRSSVSTSAAQRAALARSMSDAAKPRSRIT